MQPCVAVIGMGRSGTSATAGLLVGLGLTGPSGDDLLPATSSNERGHWESIAVIACNGRLLRAVGATPTGPPPVTLEWDGVPDHAERLAEAEEWYRDTYTGAPIVVKDPRMCLTLSFWRKALPQPLAALFVLRDPLSVARSLQARDGLPMSLGLALWDRYVRSASLGLAGMPTLVIGMTRCCRIRSRRRQRSSNSSIRSALTCCPRSGERSEGPRPGTSSPSVAG